jgi:hypothetical protein
MRSEHGRTCVGAYVHERKKEKEEGERELAVRFSNRL